MKKNSIDISKLIGVPQNRFHPLAFINGQPKIGKNVCVGFFSEVNAKGAEVVIGDNCDIASFVSINVADSHKRAIGLSGEIERKNITIEKNVFIGSHCFVGGGVHVGHHSVIAAGTILTKPCQIPPFSLVVGCPPVVKAEYYKKNFEKKSKSKKNN